jgi:branched-chain amino acid transport system substrate-binding protein
MKRILVAAAAASGAILMMTAAPAPAQETIKIGLITAMSGPFTTNGKQMENGIKTFMKQNGDQVAGKKVEILIRDSTGAAPEVAKRHAQELVSRDKVDFLVGFEFTPNALAVAPIATQAKTPTIIMLAATSVITAKSPFVARVSYTLPQAALPMGQWAAKNGIKTVFSLVSDYGPGHDSETFFKKGYTEGGGKLVGEVRVALATRDFAPFLQRIKDAKPDAAFVFLPAGEPIVSFMKEYAARGLKEAGIRIIATEGWADDDTLALVGDAALGAISTGYYSTAHESPLNKTFVKTYAEVNGPALPPNFISVAAYDGMAVIYEVAKKLGGKIDGAKAMEAIKDIKLESPRGPLTIDAETRDPIQTIYVRRVEKQGGKLVNAEFDKFENVKDLVSRSEE